MAGVIDASGTVPDGSTARWKDRKRYLWLIGLVVPSLAFVAFGLHGRSPAGACGSGSARSWSSASCRSLDLVAGPRPVQPARRRDRGAGERQVLPLDHLPVPARPVRRLRRCAFWMIADGASCSTRRQDRPGHHASARSAGSASTPPTSSATRRRANERWLSKIALAQSFYGHFYIEHNRGHHVRVATPEDPASSRVGETFYAFWPRTVAGSLRERLAPGEEALRPQGPAPVPPRQRRAQRLADVRGAVGRPGRLARPR